MKKASSRREFLGKSVIATSGGFLTPNLLYAQNQESRKAIEPKIVNEFVKIAHSDFGKVKEMLVEYPLL